MKKIVKFTKPTCPYCDIFEPIFTKEIEQYKDKIEVYEVDLSKAPHLIDIFKVKGVPSLFKFDSKDFKEFENIDQMVIGHGNEGYKELSDSLKSLTLK
jgi:thiol-disulfide isomerase/thioredoxin